MIKAALCAAKCIVSYVYRLSKRLPSISLLYINAVTPPVIDPSVWHANATPQKATVMHYVDAPHFVPSTCSTPYASSFPFSSCSHDHQIANNNGGSGSSCRPHGPPQQS